MVEQLTNSRDMWNTYGSSVLIVRTSKSQQIQWSHTYYSRIKQVQVDMGRYRGGHSSIQGWA